MGCDICWFASDCAHWIAVVAVIEEDARVLVQGFELLGCAGTASVVVYTCAYGEVLVAAADNSAKCYCGNNYFM
jgi:hypothetical protein